MDKSLLRHCSKYSIFSRKTQNYATLKLRNKLLCDRKSLFSRVTPINYMKIYFWIKLSQVILSECEVRSFE